MTPQKINITETSFRTTLKDSNGTVFSEGKHISIADGFDIIPIAAPHNTYYYATETKKKSIVLHFTVGSVKGDIATLSKKDNHVSVSYVVDRQGNIYQLFDPKYWSYHLGGACIGSNGTMSKQTIGIEISNYGPLKLTGGVYKDAYGNEYTSDTSFVEHTKNYRGYEYFCSMTERQELAVCHLIHYLCSTNNIPDTFKDNMGTVFASAADAQSFTGIMCHTDVRQDKFDWPPELANKMRDLYNSIYKAPVQSTPSEPATESVAEPIIEQASTTEPAVQTEPQKATNTQVETAINKPQPVNSPASTSESLLETLIKLILSLFGK